MTFDIGLHVMSELNGLTGVRYVITKFSGMDSLPNFLSYGAPRVRSSRRSAINISKLALFNINFDLHFLGFYLTKMLHVWNLSSG